MALFFPGTIQEALNSEFFGLLKLKARYQMEFIQTGNADLVEEVDRIEKKILVMFKPKKWLGKGGAEVRAIKNFVDTCQVLVHHGLASDPRKMTTLEYFGAVEQLEKEFRKQRIKNMT